MRARDLLCVKTSFSFNRSGMNDVHMNVYFDGSPDKVAIIFDDKTLTFSIEPIPADRPLEIEYNALI